MQDIGKKAAPTIASALAPPFVRHPIVCTFRNEKSFPIRSVVYSSMLIAVITQLYITLCIHHSACTPSPFEIPGPPPPTVIMRTDSMAHHVAQIL